MHARHNPKTGEWELYLRHEVEVVVIDKNSLTDLNIDSSSSIGSHKANEITEKNSHACSENSNDDNANGIWFSLARVLGSSTRDAYMSSTMLAKGIYLAKSLASRCNVDAICVDDINCSCHDIARWGLAVLSSSHGNARNVGFIGCKGIGNDDKSGQTHNNNNNINNNNNSSDGNNSYNSCNDDNDDCNDKGKMKKNNDGNDNTDNASRITDGIYLGNIKSSQDIDWMKRVGITHVCQVGNLGLPPFPEEFVYHLIGIDDVIDEPLIDHLHSAIAFIDACVQPCKSVNTNYISDDSNNNNSNNDKNFDNNRKGKVLVHCSAGMSRSVSVICAYLSVTNSIPPLDALKIVADRSQGPVSPNDGFIKQINAHYRLYHPTFSSSSSSSSSSSPEDSIININRITINSDGKGGSNSDNDDANCNANDDGNDNENNEQQQQQQQQQDLKYAIKGNGRGTRHLIEKSTFHCRKCRCALFISGDIDAIHSDCYRSVIPLSRPPVWLVNGIISGKISADSSGPIMCPKCRAKCGRYAPPWDAGICDCGQRIFHGRDLVHFHSAKLDERK